MLSDVAHELMSSVQAKLPSTDANQHVLGDSLLTLNSISEANCSKLFAVKLVLFTEFFKFKNIILVPYLITSVGNGADPGFLVVSL